MAIVVQTLEEQGLVEQWTIDRKLWLTEDKSRVVEDGDPESAFLYGIPGQLVAKKEALRLGAIRTEPKPPPRAKVVKGETQAP